MNKTQGEKLVAPSLKAFMQNLIDYAGLFPPAQLPMDQAIKNFLLYKQKADAWMLSRFICPAVRLEELADFKKDILSTEKHLPLSILGRGGKNHDEFMKNLFADFDDVESFMKMIDNHAQITVFETKIPQPLIDLNDAENVEFFLESAADIIECRVGENIQPFYEANFSGDWRSRNDQVIAGISSHIQTSQKNHKRIHCQPTGFKIRCGGIEAAAFPTTEQISYVLNLCREKSVPFKATAGLHHPVRHYNESVQTKMHGFFNLFCAGILAVLHELKEEQIRKIIEEENPENFIFSDSDFRWKNLKATASQIKNLRKNFAISYGSCSFDEPREDLKILGLI